ncbi:hypothetical protein STHAL_32075 [Streptomyces halstedii]|uniref:Uncharacterized protein n=1 Tax=Streptomyces halstedii TaxID=1944 RepID=A0ABS6U0M5_STRHA|nr:DUF6409 family protein [Streptomyces halstedii]MBV7674086.1 hypothetical protein [Streptomyces halstedii]
MAVTVVDTPSASLVAGTVVRCPLYVNGENAGPRKAVLLGLFNENDPRAGYRVYFYTLGPASFAPRTVGFVFPGEVTVVGTVEDLSERTLVKLYQGLDGFPGAAAVRRRAGRLARRLREARLAR